MLELEDDLFDDLELLNEAELGARFDELVAMAAEQPEEKVVFSGLKQLIEVSYQRGEFDMVAQMAMTLGAMACIDSHFESLATEAGILTDNHGKDDGHGHEDAKEEKHDSKNCKACSAGRYCRRR